MNLLRCHIPGFGRLADVTFDFKSGLNLVFAPNEAGKTTLQRFLVGMLYGQLRPDLKSQRRLESWVEGYKPWRRSDYGGVLWCGLANGRELEIRRAFGKDEARLEIRVATGEDISREYEQQRNGEVLFARFHLGLPKELFESVAVVRENRAAELQGRDTIRDRIANLAQAGDEELSIRHSLDKLQASIEAVGSERAPIRPYRQTLDRLEALQDEKRALESRRAEFEHWLAERARTADEVLRLERELRAAQATVVTARWGEASEKVRVLGEIEGEIRSLRCEMDSLEAKLDFPAHNLENLNQLAGARESIESRLVEARKGLEGALRRLRQAEQQKETLGPYAGLISAIETEKITEWFVSHLSLSLQKDEAQRSLGLLRDEISSLEGQLNRLGPAFGDAGADWQRKEREASEEERAAAEKNLQVAQKVSEHMTILAAGKGKTARLRTFGVVALLLAFLPLGIWRLLGAETLPTLPAIVLAAALLAGAAPLLIAASRSRRAEREIEQAIASLESDRGRIRDEFQAAQREIRQAMAESGYETIEQFLAATKQAEQWRQRMADLGVRVQETERHRDKMLAESGVLYSRLQASLARVGLSCSPGTLKAQVDVLRTNLRRFRELDNDYRNCVQETDALCAQEADLVKEAGLLDFRIKAILEDAGVESAAVFREACDRRRRMLELLEKESSRVREFQRLCGRQTLEQWKDRLRELEQLKELAREAVPKGMQQSPKEASANARVPYLPYQPGVSEAELEEKRLSSLLAVAREEHARLVERVSQAFRNFRAASEIEEDLSEAGRAVQELLRNRKALELALETIQLLCREQQEVLAPQLNYAVEQCFLRLCQGRYREVKIDPDLQVWLREATTGELRAIEDLSRGTQDQLYFALRFAILDLVSNAAEPCPCILDEPFAAYDRARMLEAFRILEDEGGRRQLILFTCREDLRDLARSQGAHILELTIDD